MAEKEIPGFFIFRTFFNIFAVVSHLVGTLLTIFHAISDLNGQPLGVFQMRYVLGGNLLGIFLLAMCRYRPAITSLLVILLFIGDLVLLWGGDILLAFFFNLNVHRAF